MRVLDVVLLVAAVAPVLAVVVGSWLFLRAGRRWDARQRGVDRASDER